jgi:cytoskeletal protein RodZ
MASTSPFGEHLRREREMRGVSLAEISSATRISTKFLEAIENGKWDELPGGAFNRGYIRSTSRYLGLDEDGMVAEYALETKGNGTRQATLPSPPVPRVSRRWAVRIAAIACAIILFITLAWLVTSKLAARLHRHNLAGPGVFSSPELLRKHVQPVSVSWPC